MVNWLKQFIQGVLQVQITLKSELLYEQLERLGLPRLTIKGRRHSGPDGEHGRLGLPGVQAPHKRGPRLLSPPGYYNMLPTRVCGQSFDAFVGHTRGRRGRSCHQVLCLVAGVLLVACQTGRPPAMSVEEAKRVTVRLSGESFIPPPRTINDILAALERESGERETRRPLADAAEPPNASATALADFYRRRGLKAKELGLAKQQLDDLRKAADYARRASLSKSEEKMISIELGWAELTVGNYRRAIEVMTAATTERDSWAAGAYSGLVQMYAVVGDLDAARRAMSQARSLGHLPNEWAAVQWAEMNYHLLGATGRLAEAEVEIRRSFEAFRSAGLEARFPTWVERNRPNLVANLVGQGRLAEAESEARDGLRASLAKTGKYSFLTARLVQRLAQVLDEQGRYADAERLSRVAIEILEKVGTPRGSLWFASSRSRLTANLVSQGRWAEAVEEFRQIRAETADNEFMYQRVFGPGLDHPLALIKSGSAAQAVPLVRPTVEQWKVQFGDDNYRTASARGVLAMALAATGQKEVALEEFRRAVPVLLTRLRQAEGGSEALLARSKRLAIILEAYLTLLDDIRGSRLEQGSGIDVTAEMFRVADAIRSGTVQKALGASAARAAARDPVLADLVRREQDSALQIGALYGALANQLSAPPDQQDVSVVQTLRTRVTQLSRAREALADEIRKKFPSYAELVAPQPATLEDARASLRAGEALVALYAGDDRTFVWAVPRSGPVRFASAALPRQRVEVMVRALRWALDSSARTLGEVPAFDVETAHALHAALLKPVKPAWREAKSLLVVAHGPLAQVPFSLLLTEPASLGPEPGALFANYRRLPWLVRQVAVTHLPSVAALRTLRALPPGDPGRRSFVGFGDPWFSEAQAAEATRGAEPTLVALAGRDEGIESRAVPILLRKGPEVEGVDSAELARLPRLPDTAEEVREVAAALGADVGTDVFLGARANEQVVKTLDLKHRRVLAFATHGLQPGDLNGLLQPALALSAPQVAGVNGDGLLTMEEILALRLDADWVILSACNTAAGSGAGAEAVSGLGRAFFYAGARALLVSHWPVETTSARALVTEVFRRQAARPGLTRAEALREAMLALMDGPGFVDPVSKRTVFSYAHPLFWAPFALVGDGGG